MRHGSASTYRNHGCRCDECRAARKAERGSKPTSWLVYFPSCIDCGTLFTTRARSCHRCDLCRALHRKAVDANRKPPGICARCGGPAWQRKQGTICHPCRRVQPAPSKHRESIPCGHCGKALTRKQMGSKQRFCSMSCAKLAEPSGSSGPRLSDEERRARSRMRDVRRRVKLASVTIESVDPLAIYERDGWRCHLCGKRVDGRLNGNARMGPTLDHVVPLSKGGEHSRANVALAHRQCNILKGNRAAGEQLALIG